MEKIYLVRADKNDASRGMVNVTGKEFYAITQANQNLPVEERRYFLANTGYQNSRECLVVWETTRQDYLIWQRDMEIRRRHDRNFRENVPTCSLDAMAESEYGDCIAPDYPSVDMVENAAAKERMLRLKAALEKRKNAECDTEMTAMYMEGQKRKCPSALAKKYGECARTMRNRRNELDSFLIEFYKAEDMHN